VIVINASQDDFSRQDVERCAEALRAGGVGIIPTDTVYGLAALASDERAVERVMRLKDRAADKPLPVQVASALDANLLGAADSPAAVALIERFWPGPLTIVMERRQGIDLPFQPAGTIGLRIPDSRFCLALIMEAGYLVVPSANPPGAAPPVTPGDIEPAIRQAVDFIVEAGPCAGGVESTVVDISAGVNVLREGAIPARDVARALEAAEEEEEGVEGGGAVPAAPAHEESHAFGVLFVCLGNLCRSPMAEGMARDFVARDYPGSSSTLAVASAGVGALEGEPATEEAVRAMAARGIDITAHRARRVTPSMLAGFDLVLTMEDRHGEGLLMMGVTAPVFVLLKLGEAAGEAMKERDDIWKASTIAPRLERLVRFTERIEREALWSMPPYEYDVPDPIGLSLDGYVEVAGRMERPIADFLRALLGGPPPVAR
jgi:L-threonylcarbamoyladenylate synthase